MAFNKIVKTKQLLETGPAGIEAKVKRYARTQGFYVRKFSSPSNRSVPDDIFITPLGLTFFVEFKSTGKKPTDAQEREINKILVNKGIVFVVDNIGGDGVTHWKKNCMMDIVIVHDGYKLINTMAHSHLT